MTGSSRRQKKLYKDPNDKKIAGVASGVAKYFDVDTTMVRVVWVVVSLGGLGILLYVILWAVLDDEPAELEDPPVETDASETTDDDETTAAETGEDDERNTDTGDLSSG